MRNLVFIILSLCAVQLLAVDTVHVKAPAYAGEHAVLYVYDDLITRRVLPVAQQLVGASGKVDIPFNLTTTTRCRLRIGKVSAELFLTPGTQYDLFFPELPAGKAMGHQATIEPEFFGMDQFDRNALASDLNYRIDAFLADAWGMSSVTDPKAVHDLTFAEQRPDGTSVGTHKGMPYSPAQVDSFEQKLNVFYVDVKDAWFTHHREFAMANLRIHPRINKKDLFERYITGHSVKYDDPEHIRFLQQFFDGQLINGPFRSMETELRYALNTASRTKLLELITINTLLEPTDPIAEFVLINELYSNYNSKEFDKKEILGCLQMLASTTTTAEHAKIITNVIWDLSQMKAGSVFPNFQLTDPLGMAMPSDSLLNGYAYLMFTRENCTRCDQERAGMEQLESAYGSSISFPMINVGNAPAIKNAYQAEDDPLLLEELRVHSLPAFFLLKDGILLIDHTLAPSDGAGAMLHKIHVEKEKEGKLKVWDD